jgi:hypothetical protein
LSRSIEQPDQQHLLKGLGRQIWSANSRSNPITTTTATRAHSSAAFRLLFLLRCAFRFQPNPPEVPTVCSSMVDSFNCQCRLLRAKCDRNQGDDKRCRPGVKCTQRNLFIMSLSSHKEMEKKRMRTTKQEAKGAKD